jgi:hypothetical protein
MPASTRRSKAPLPNVAEQDGNRRRRLDPGKRLSQGLNDSGVDSGRMSGPS